ncbi:N-acetylmuramoyl-L-alanine amidase family protein [Pararcticibacter amylolyticus]|uniref:N-acetylmuramoyl-L-alanine amidase n=1 Tax=Pararcticibacter amylolyticus TaxID=2173175 RepID=A0A2U2PG34_9SPHI|nr:N-acetylmuramoyl-L-alanine amidase [Pararcticibacter amylolyticus]PWG80367.1 N-acetylmuramoyl-L-alanine amidase [Pararcticibacter amylolyticus]
MKIIPLKRLVSGLLALFLFFPFVSFSNNYKIPPYRIKTIVIDAGHGGKDGATRGLIAREKDVALQVALRLGKAISEALPEVKVVYTRTEDVFIPLYERIGLANKLKADMFISIHCNSMPSNMRNRTASKGVETFVSGFGRLDEQNTAIRENASILLEKDYEENYEGYDPKDPESIIIFSLLKNAYREQSIRLATLIQNEYISTGRIDRGVKEQSLAVLAKAGMPAVLTEIGFISNPEEEEYMVSENGQNEIVSCLLKAVQTYKKQVEKD